MATAHTGTNPLPTLKYEEPQILESVREMGTGKNARQRRIVYQRSFKRQKRDDSNINKMIERAERIAAGKAPMQKARLLKVTGAHKGLDQTTIDRARQLAGLKGYVANLPATTLDGAAIIGAHHDLWQVEASFRPHHRSEEPHYRSDIG